MTEAKMKGAAVSKAILKASRYDKGHGHYTRDWPKWRL